MWSKKKFLSQKQISSYQKELDHLNEIFSPINPNITNNNNQNQQETKSQNNNNIVNNNNESKITNITNNIPLFTRRKRFNNPSNIFNQRSKLPKPEEEIITFESEENIESEEHEDNKKENQVSEHNSEDNKILSNEYINIDYEPNIHDEDEEENEILQQKIDQLLEFKDHRRKCLLNENEDKLYGGNTQPKDIIKDIYSIINNDSQLNNNEEIAINEEIDSDNEQMLKKWEENQYKSGLNLHNLQKKYKEDTEENIDEVFQGVYNKCKSKSILINYNEIINQLTNDINQDKIAMKLVDKRKEQYKHEINILNENEIQVKEKIDYYIKQYKRIIKELENTEWVKDVKKEETEDDYVIESNIKIYNVVKNKKREIDNKEYFFKGDNKNDLLYISS